VVRRDGRTTWFRHGTAQFPRIEWTRAK
jgi:hypothetical protein